MTVVIPNALPPDSQRTLRPVLRRVWRAAKVNKGLVAAIFALGVLEAFFTKAPISLLKPLESSLTGGGSGTKTPDRFMAWFTGFASDLSDWLGLTDLDPRMQLCLACGVLASIAGLLGAPTIYGTLVLTRYFATKIVVDIRNEVAGHILMLPMRFFGKRRMGELMSNITTDTTVLGRALQLACDHVVVDPLLILFNAGLIVLYLPQATWVLALMVPVMAIPLIRMGRKVHKSSSRSLAAMGDATESMNQMLSGMRTVKAFQLERARLEEFERNNNSYLRRTLRMLRAKATSQAFVFAIYQVGLAVMLLGAGWLVIRRGQNFGDLLIGLVAVATTYAPVKRLARAYNTLMESGGALERIEDLLAQRLDAGATGGGVVLAEIRGAVAFESVSFAYGTEAVLKNVSFQVEPGQTVALVGPSGAGKTTALDLLARFHDPSDGRILIDGIDLREINLPSYRRRTAMVSQQPFLFNASLYENIACGRPGATRDEVIEAAKVAQIHDFIASQPEGYDAVAGERGCNVSGGQMQRITIARAILRDPAILMLDEATSSLDSESEGAVQQALDNLMKGRTSFVIAHRLSTIVNADQILVIERGRIVESGRHSELIARGGLYSRLSELQQLAGAGTSDSGRSE